MTIEPTAHPVIEETSRGYRVVLVYTNGCRVTVGTHTAKYKAAAQADRLAGRTETRP